MISFSEYKQYSGSFAELDRKSTLLYTVLYNVHCTEMWWFIGCTPDFRDRGPGFESGISHNDPDAQQDHCVIKYRQLRVETETYH